MLLPAFNIGFWNILFWIFVGIAIGGILARLLSGRSETTSRWDSASLLGRKVTVSDEHMQVADELQAIEGIGPQIAALLHKHGVHRYHQLADMSPDDITGMLAQGGSKFDISQPFTWPFQAKLLAGGLVAEHAALCQRLNGGRLPLTGIKGLGPATATRLSAAGIDTIEQLAAADATDLTAKLEAAGESVAINVVRGWIDHARNIKVGDLEHLAVYFGIPATAIRGRPAVTYAETREVTGPLVEATSLADVYGATTETAQTSLLPFWIGLIGALLLALLSALGILRTPDAKVELPKMPSLGISAIETELGTDTSFETNSAVLTEAGKAAISAKIIDPARNLDVTNVQVVGHADVRGDDAANLKLSRDRAESVANYMRETVKAQDIKWNPRVIQVYGAGEEFPNPDADTARDCASLEPTSQQASDCYAPDRRVDVTILTKGSSAEIERAKAASESGN